MEKPAAAVKMIHIDFSLLISESLFFSLFYEVLNFTHVSKSEFGKIARILLVRINSEKNWND